MVTARTICKKAMQKIGVLVKSETPDDDEANDAFDALNALIESWSNFSANIFSRVTETFPLTTAINYTIGAGANFNTARPIQIIDAYVTQGGVDYPVDIITQEIYNSVSIKSTSGRPQYLSYDNAYPNGNIKLYPVPEGSYTLTILSEKPITAFATLDTVMVLPVGWERALIYNLALEIAPEYAQQPDALVADVARKSLGAIKLAVVRSRPIENTVSMLRENIFTGWVYR